jgi:8-hydroxy-5-deazaflavin:NADPH oxidoreductase
MLSWWLNEIAVIGTGNIGGMLARKLSAAGHDLRIANSRGLEDIRAFANEIEATAADTRGAVEGVDFVVISIPFAALAERTSSPDYPGSRS